MMAERHRLGRLQMGETRHHRVGMGERLFGQRALIAARARASMLVDGVAHPEPEIGRHLIVARARGMQPSRRRPDQLASRLSTFIWMSSSARLKANLPASISDRIVSRP